MADIDVATKSPENDAAEGDAPQPSEHCVSDRPLSGGEVPTGELSQLADVDVYIAKPSDYPHSPSRLLLFLTGGTGIHSRNNQLQADRFAKKGYLVVMPDQFAGDPAPSGSVEDSTDGENDRSFIEEVKLRAAETAKAFMIDMWLARHTPEKVLPLLLKVLENAKEEFADAVASGGGVYSIGYCFGAKYVLLLAAGNPEGSTGRQRTKDEEEGMINNKPLIKAGALAHGTMITREDIEKTKAPISMACVENDQLFPDEIRDEGKRSLENNNIEHEIIVYPNVPHGFAVLGEYKDQAIQEAQSKAFDQMLAWLQTH